jgi:hypothetical protein
LQAAGVDFPPREKNSVPLFTPPQTQPLRQPHLYPPPGQSYEDAAIEASLQSDPSVPALRFSFICLPICFLVSDLSDLVPFLLLSSYLYYYTSVVHLSLILLVFLSCTFFCYSNLMSVNTILNTCLHFL